MLFEVQFFKKSKKFKNSHVFYVSYLKNLYHGFLNFVTQQINSKIIKCGMMMVIER
jgi:hypothetical protein